MYSRSYVELKEYLSKANEGKDEPLNDDFLSCLDILPKLKSEVRQGAITNLTMMLRQRLLLAVEKAQENEKHGDMSEEGLARLEKVKDALGKWYSQWPEESQCCEALSWVSRTISQRTFAKKAEGVVEQLTKFEKVEDEEFENLSTKELLQATIDCGHMELHSEASALTISFLEKLFAVCRKYFPEKQEERFVLSTRLLGILEDSSEKKCCGKNSHICRTARISSIARNHTSRIFLQ